MRIGILEKILVYIFHTFLKNKPDSFLNNDKSTDNLKISPNKFYSKRFSAEKIKEKTKEIKNKFIKNFVKNFKEEIIKKPNSFFKKKFYQQFNNFLSNWEIMRKEVNVGCLSESNNIQLFYSKKTREPIENFDFKLIPDNVYKIERLKFNKLLNMVLFKKDLNFSKKNFLYFPDEFLYNAIQDITNNDDFNDIIRNKSAQVKYLKIITMVYDLIVKYFYIPFELTEFEKIAYESYWLKKFKELEFNNIEIKYLNKHLAEIKDILFTKDIQKLLDIIDLIIPNEKFENILPIEKNIKNNQNINLENFYENITHKDYSILNEYFNEFNSEKIAELEKIKKNKENNNNFNNINLQKNNSGNNNIRLDTNFDLMKKAATNIPLIQNIETLKHECLKRFLIWNTIFIIFFRKNFKYIKFIETISQSNKLSIKYKNIKKEEDNICQNSQFLYLFSSFFFLSENEENENPQKNFNKKIGQIYKKKKIDEYINEYKEFICVNPLGDAEQDSITPKNSFYKDISSYVFNTNDWDYQKNLKKNSAENMNNYHFPNKFVNFYPGIFAYLWDGFDSFTKKVLFFGMNFTLFNLNLKSEKVNEKDYYNELIEEDKSRENDQKSPLFKITRFMKSEHRSHFFYFLNFTDDKFDECKRSIFSLLESKIIFEDFEKLKSYEELFKFINESKLTIGIIYQIYKKIFDSLFADLKIIFIELIYKHNKLFTELLCENVFYFSKQRKKMKFVKFFKYELSLKKFGFLTGNVFFNFFNLFLRIF